MIALEAGDLPIPFVGQGGWKGTLHPAPSGYDETRAIDYSRLLVRADDGGAALLVPAEIVTQRGDGTYFLPLARREAEATYAQKAQGIAEETVVIPLVEETLTVDKRMVETGTVRIVKTVHENHKTVNESLFRENVQVTRVPINKTVDAPQAARHENGVLIIPLYEEVLVVEKRLLLKEELHVAISQTTEPFTQTVVLRHEEAQIRRTDSTADSTAERSNNSIGDAFAVATQPLADVETNAPN